MQDQEDDFGELDITNYIKTEKKGNGTYGVVYRAMDKKNNREVALKKMISAIEEEGIPSTAIREISLLREIDHPNVIKLINIVIDQKFMYLVFEYAQMDLKQYIDQLPPQEFLDPLVVKNFLFQILQGVNACHAKRILHRDLKPQNILISEDKKIKLADFGLARTFSIPVRPYTHEVVTMWYRPPEILLGATEYSTAVDIWSVGTIFVEMITKKPLFMGDSEFDQIFRIFRILGTPNETMWPNVTQLKDFKVTFPNYKPNKIEDIINNLNLDEVGLDLLNRMLKYNPNERIKANAALNHPYFNDLNNDKLKNKY